MLKRYSRTGNCSAKMRNHRLFGHSIDVPLWNRDIIGSVPKYHCAYVNAVKTMAQKRNNSDLLT